MGYLRMTKQEIFDKVATHLLTQNIKSLRDVTSCEDGVLYSGCAYRGDNGTKCAIGCLIPDEAYLHEIEGSTCRSGAVVELLKSLYDFHTEYQMSFLRQLQIVHDRSPVDMWKYQLKHLAEDHMLDASVLDKF